MNQVNISIFLFKNELIEYILVFNLKSIWLKMNQLNIPIFKIDNLGI